MNHFRRRREGSCSCKDCKDATPERPSLCPRRSSIGAHSTRPHLLSASRGSSFLVRRKTEAPLPQPVQTPSRPTESGPLKAAHWVGAPIPDLNGYVVKLALYDQQAVPCGKKKVSKPAAPTLDRISLYPDDTDDVPAAASTITEPHVSFQNITGRIGGAENDSDLLDLWPAEDIEKWIAVTKKEIVHLPAAVEQHQKEKDHPATDSGYASLASASPHLSASASVYSGSAMGSKSPSGYDNYPEDVKSPLSLLISSPAGKPVDLYKFARYCGWRQINSEELDLKPSPECQRSMDKELTRMAFLGCSVKQLEQIVAGKGGVVEGLRLTMDLQRALGYSEWQCPDQPADHDSRTCKCRAKTRKVLLCHFTYDAVTRLKAEGEWLIRDGCANRVLPWVVESFELRWGRGGMTIKQVRKFAEEVEQLVPELEQCCAK